MARSLVFDHRNSQHRTISLSPDRALAIKRVAQSQKVSSHVIIQRFITAGLVVFAEVDNAE